jgi:hypothetical protein
LDTLQSSKDARQWSQQRGGLDLTDQRGEASMAKIKNEEKGVTYLSCGGLLARMREPFVGFALTCGKEDWRRR